MAWAQNDSSRGVSLGAMPSFDLNHWRCVSISEISAIGVRQTAAAIEVNSS